MEDPVGPVVIGVGAANNAYEREVLAVGAGNGIEDAEASDGEGDGASTDSAGPSVTVGGVSGIELVAAADEVEPGLVNEMVEEREVEVTRDGEDVTHPYLHEAASQVAAERGLGGAAVEGGVLDGEGAGGGGVAYVIVQWLTRVNGSNLRVHKRNLQIFFGRRIFFVSLLGSLL